MPRPDGSDPPTIPTGYRPPQLVGPPCAIAPHRLRFGFKKKSKNRMRVWKKSAPSGELASVRSPPSRRIT